MRLHLPDEVHVGGDYGPEHEIAAAGDGVAVKDDGLGSARDLNGPVRIAAVDDV
jgi:hypothetical protein